MTVLTKRRTKYMELVKAFPLTAIENERHLDEALSIIGSLVDRDSLTKDEGAYLHALSILAGDYEDEHHAIPPLSESDLLSHLLEERGEKQVELARATGISAPVINDVLREKRRLTRDQIVKVAKHFKVPVGLFLWVED